MFTLQQNIAVALRQPYSSQMVANSQKQEGRQAHMRHALKTLSFWRVINKHALWGNTPQGYEFWKRHYTYMKIRDNASSSAHIFDVW